MTDAVPKATATPQATIVPHRPPFLFVKEILASDNERMRVSAVVPADCPYVDGNETPRTLLVEVLAQGMAAHASAAKHEANHRGVLAMVKNVTFASDVAPGETFVVEVSLRRVFAKLLYYEARAHNAAGELICQGELVAAQVPE